MIVPMPNYVDVMYVLSEHYEIPEFCINANFLCLWAQTLLHSFNPETR